MHFCDGSLGNFFGGSAFFNPLFEVPFDPFFGGFRGFFPRRRFGFRQRLRPLLNFPVSVLTTGGVAPVTGILTSVGRGFITLSGGPGGVSFIPIREISAISPVF